MNVVLGVAGGIAAYKACIVLRALRERGHSVRVVPTAAALEFVGAPTWEALSGQPVASSVFTRVDEVEHVSVGDGADLVVVVPATADLLARTRAGMADDMLTATLLVATCPVVMVPAMHTQMWFNPATVDNVAVLRSRGIQVMEPASGRLTGADSGPGRLPEPADIVDFALAAAAAAPTGAPSAVTDVSAPDATPPSRDRAPRTSLPRVVISAGGTREPLDPVRFLGNRSSGKQGIALARAASGAGYAVDLVAANIDAALLAGLPAAVAVHPVETTRELESAMQDLARGAIALVMAAAVADYRPAEVTDHKMKKHGSDGLTIELEQNPDVLAGLVARRAPGQTIIGFAAETGDDTTSAYDYARAKLVRKGADFLVFNDVSGGKAFGTDSTTVTVLHRSGDEVHDIGTFEGTKDHVSQDVICTILARARG